MTKTKPFAVFDIDGTLIRWQMLHAMIDQLGRGGHISSTDYQAIRQTRLIWKQRKNEDGYREYESQLVKVIQNSITNISVRDFSSAAKAAFDEYKDQVYRYTRDLIASLKGKGYMLLAISGSPQEVIAPVAEYYGFDSCIGSTYVQKNGKFTGEIHVAALNKPKLLQELVEKYSLNYQGSLGMGDSESDIGMLDMVEQAIAFNPSKKLFLHAEKKGWKIVLERKNMFYELDTRGKHYQLVNTSAKG